MTEMFFCRNKDLSPSINYVISMNCVYLGINATLFLRFSVLIDIMPLHQRCKIVYAEYFIPLIILLYLHQIGCIV